MLWTPQKVFWHNAVPLVGLRRGELWVPTKKYPIQVIDHKVWDPRREELIDVEGATYLEILASLQLSNLIGFGASAGFVPITNTYISGSGTDTAPSGASNCGLTSWGGGGGGGRSVGTGAGGGAGGGKCASPTIAVAGGNALNYAVGPGGAGRTGSAGTGTAGTASTTSGGTGGFTGVAHNAGGGPAGTSAAGGAASSASGGTTNTSGGAGTTGIGPVGKGGDSGGGNGVGGANDTGVGAGDNVAGSEPGGGGGAGFGDDAKSGAFGRHVFAYT